MDFITQSKNQVIHDFMSAHPCAALATCGKEGKIAMANVFAAVDERFNLYIISRPGNRKVVNIGAHPTVSLMFTDALSATQVEYAGAAHVLEAQVEVSDALKKLHAATGAFKASYWVPPVSQLEASGYVLVKVKPNRIVYRVYGGPGTEHEHEEIEAVLR